jgi:single-stranded-DNA-specific exonuclease
VRKKWIRCEVDLELRERISQGLGISPIVAQILVNRGIREMEQAREFLVVSPANLLSPFLLNDMDRAVDRLLTAMEKGQKILIYGDYDVDGVSATSLFTLFFRSQGVEADRYIPDRMTEGYGLNVAAMATIRDRGASVIITADCGTTSFQEIEAARAYGMDVIITDHHEPAPELPRAYALLNPNRRDSVYPFKGLTGVGVAFKLAQGILMRKAGRAGTDGRTAALAPDFPPELYDYLDLVTLGTIADVAPIIGENRFFIKEGLQLLTRARRTGIAALKEVAGVKGAEASVGMVGFSLAPRLNAAGRLSRADDGVQLLTTGDHEEAMDIARRLDRVNMERQKIEEQIRKEAREQVLQQRDVEKEGVIVLESSSWHPGVIGIVASKIAEEFFRPAVLIAVGPDGIGKGSARSIPAFHLYEALAECRPLLEGFGGHKYAAGLTIRSENIPALRTRLSEVARQTLKAEDFIPRLKVDMEVELGGISFALLKEMDLLSPFGVANPEPVLTSRGIDVTAPKIVGRGHLKMRARQGQVSVDTIGFQMGDTYRQFTTGEQRVDMAYTPELNLWNGTYGVQLRLRDLRWSGLDDEHC